MERIEKTKLTKIETMSIKELLAPKLHIIDARNIAEGIYKNNKPEAQLEMLTEIKSQLVKLTTNNINQLETI